MKSNSVRILNLCFILTMTLLSMSADANSLNKLDIKRSNASASTLNITMFTSNPYDENIAVTKKDDNKYVILMPNVSNASASSVDFSSIKDIVSNVDVKSVSDGGNSYTKVTLTTTKPVAINTSTRKSAPLTDEQKAYKNLIAQSRTAAINSKTANTSSHANQSNVADISAIRAKTVVEPPKSSLKTNDSKSSSSVVPTTAIAFGGSKISDTNKSLLSEKPISLQNVNKNTSKTEQTLNKVKDKNINNGINDLQDNELPTANPEKDAPLLNNISNDNVNEIYSNQYKKFNQNIFITIALLLISVFGLLTFFKNIKKSLEHSAMLKRTFKENLHQKPMVIGDYSNIVNDKSLNWQEKYQKFVNTLEDIYPEESLVKPIGNGEYEFVNSIDAVEENQTIEKGYTEILNPDYQTDGNAVLDIKDEPLFKAYNKPAMNYSPDAVPSIKKVQNPELGSKNKNKKLELVGSSNNKNKKKNKNNFRNVVSNLEKSYAISPSVERLKLEDDDDMIIKQLEESFKFGALGEGFVINEDDIISESLRRSPKLKAFANKIALEQTKRRLPSPKQRSEIIRTKYIEAKQVNFDNSELYRSSRKYADTNLSSADLLASGNFKVTGSTKVTSPIDNNKKYSTVSVDDYFDAIDSSSKVTASASLASRVADRLAKMSVEFIKPSERKNRKSQRNILADKIVKAGYNIDDKSGFYIIENSDGSNSLIGRINNDITVLKEFSSSVPAKLSVRLDSDNVYIVRAAGERYLVEINDTKMSVLLEL